MKVRKAVIPAAGLGTRLYPASTALPKAFFPFVDRDGLAKPLIQIVAEEAAESGIEQICIIVQPGEQSFYTNYFRGMDDRLRRRFAGKDWAILESEKLAALGQRLHFAEQATAEGFGHAVYQAKSFVGPDPFLLILGDHIFLSATKDRCARQLIDVFDRYDGLDAVTAVQPTQEQDLHLFGTIRGEPVDPQRGVYKAQLIIEKPAVQVARQQLMTPGIPMGTYLSHFGMHIFSPRIFDALEHLFAHNLRDKGEFQLTSAQERLRQATGRYYIALIQGQRLDAGIPLGMLETQLTLGLYGTNRTKMSETIARILASQVRD